MIKASELRIGNYIQTVKKLKFEILSNDDFKSVEKHPDFYEPIVVTPEILTKCGFEMKNGSDGFVYYERNGLQLSWYLFKLKRIVISQYNTTVYDLAYNYLHQLQNLYYALVGEELPKNMKL